jgi:hypothetical protein
LKMEQTRNYRGGPNVAITGGPSRSITITGHTRVPESLFGEIHRRTGGVPRMITALCGAAIERCEDTRADAVSLELLDSVASEFGI